MNNMNQEWNRGLTLPQDILERCETVKPVDIIVGVLCKDVEATILNVLNVINEGLYRYFPENTKAIVISKATSTDRWWKRLRCDDDYGDSPCRRGKSNRAHRW
jgi:hypothetical protein